MKIISEIGDLNQYDGTELSIVVEFTLPDGARACESMATLDSADVNLNDFVDPVMFYSVYLHVKTGGVNCVADFDALDDAQILCHALDTLLGVNNAND